MTARLPDGIAISDRRSLPLGDPRPWLAALAAAGVGAVQLREKDLDDLALFELVVAARRLLPPPGLLLVNGRADIALAGGADGVHLPADGLPTAALRARFPDLRIGRSTHHLEEVARARDEGADYVTFGPIFATPSKAAFGPPLGLAALARAARCGVPVFALGGVGRRHLTAVAAAGASGVAAIRLFQDTEHLAEVRRELARAFPRTAAIAT